MIVAAAKATKEKDEADAKAAEEAKKNPLEKLHSPCVVPQLFADSENNLATYFDVAVVRCLFISHWNEDGVFWALTYLNRR
jgi:hypothetical protein